MKDETKPEYDVDEGPLSEEFMKFFRKKAEEKITKGKIINTESLFDKDFLKKD